MSEPSLPTLESALLLRVPVHVAEQLRKQLGEKLKPDALAAGAFKEDKSSTVRITFTTEEGQLKLQMGNQGVEMKGQLVNLPSIIEVQKTFDQIHYYKAADIGQMLVVQAPTAAPSSATASLTTNPTRPKDASADGPPLPPIDFPHGLTPPTRDIRPKRYEKNTVVPYPIVRDVDTLLANLRDEKAVHTFELLEEEEEVEINEEEEAAAEMDQEGEEEEEEVLAEGGGTDERMDTGGTGERRPTTGQRPDTSGRPRTGLLATPMMSGARLASPQLASPMMPQPSASPQFDRSGPGGMTGQRLGTGERPSTSFGRTPGGLHGDTDMTDVEMSEGPVGGPLTSPPVAASGINVDQVEQMFGTPAMTIRESSPTTATTMDFLSPMGDMSLPAPSPPVAPPSALELLRGELSEVDGRLAQVEKDITGAINAILKRKAEARKAAIVLERKAIEDKIAALPPT